jgi:MtN3 and saliva related transmembrane protein
MDVNTLGYVAACLTTLAFVPQVMKTVKTKSTDDISLIMFLMFNLGIVLWLIYGVILESKPIILANTVTGIFALIILGYKIRNTIKKP